MSGSEIVACVLKLGGLGVDSRCFWKAEETVEGTAEGPKEGHSGKGFRAWHQVWPPRGGMNSSWHGHPTHPTQFVASRGRVGGGEARFNSQRPRLSNPCFNEPAQLRREVESVGQYQGTRGPSLAGE